MNTNTFTRWARSIALVLMVSASSLIGIGCSSGPSGSHLNGGSGGNGGTDNPGNGGNGGGGGSGSTHDICSLPYAITSMKDVGPVWLWHQDPNKVMVAEETTYSGDHDAYTGDVSLKVGRNFAYLRVGDKNNGEFKTPANVMFAGTKIENRWDEKGPNYKQLVFDVTGDCGVENVTDGSLEKIDPKDTLDGSGSNPPPPPGNTSNTFVFMSKTNRGNDNFVGVRYEVLGPDYETADVHRQSANPWKYQFTPLRPGTGLTFVFRTKAETNGNKTFIDGASKHDGEETTYNGQRVCWVVKGVADEPDGQPHAYVALGSLGDKTDANQHMVFELGGDGKVSPPPHKIHGLTRDYEVRRGRGWSDAECPGGFPED